MSAPEPTRPTGAASSPPPPAGGAAPTASRTRHQRAPLDLDRARWLAREVRDRSLPGGLSTELAWVAEELADELAWYRTVFQPLADYARPDVDPDILAQVMRRIRESHERLPLVTEDWARERDRAYEAARDRDAKHPQAAAYLDALQDIANHDCPEEGDCVPWCAPCRAIVAMSGADAGATILRRLGAYETFTARIRAYQAQYRRPSIRHALADLDHALGASQDGEADA